MSFDPKHWSGDREGGSNCGRPECAPFVYCTHSSSGAVKPSADQNAQAQKQIDRCFKRHTPTDDQLDTADMTRDIFHDVASRLIRIVPPGRERARMLTMLEDASMAAIAAIVRPPEGGARG